jgi:serralysin
MPRYSGTSASRTLVGSTVADTLNGGTGNDRMIGGLGNDTFDFNYLSELVLGATRDVISGWNTRDRIDLTSIDWNNDCRRSGLQLLNVSAFSTTAGQVRYSAGVSLLS